MKLDPALAALLGEDDARLVQNTIDQHEAGILDAMGATNHIALVRCLLLMDLSSKIAQPEKEIAS